jgi:Spy/CpxP family protein refolding chaperone
MLAANMRIAILIALPAAPAFAQRPCQSQELALDRYKVLLRSQVMTAQQVDAAREAYAECQAQQAQIAAVKARENAVAAQLDELRKKYKDSFPDVVLAKAQLAELRAQEASLMQGLRRTPDSPASVKPETGGLLTGLPDRWWKNYATAQSLGLTPEQQRRMDDVFQQYRLRLIDLNAALEKEEVTLEPLVGAEPLDESKAAAQIDRVAQARAELEKANGRMLLGLRKQLTPEQWGRLNQGSSPSPAQK